MARARRICPRPGCPHIAEGRYCPAHNREYENKRGNATQRGYDRAHQLARIEWGKRIAQGGIICARCPKPVLPGQPWHLDHDDNDRTKYLGPAHARCNLAAAGRKAHKTE